MAFPQLSTPSVLTLAILFVSIYFAQRLRASKETDQPTLQSIENALTQSAKELRSELKAALPNSVISPSDAAGFRESTRTYWAEQECEVAPSCVVRPRDVKELSKAVVILKRWMLSTEHASEGKEDASTASLFAVRSGGHHHAAGAASTKGGVLIDLSLFNKVTIAEDGSTVSFGAGLRWGEVFKALRERGLAAVGARNESVGVGGFTLGSGYSVYSPQYGFAASNISSYEVILASGSVVTASATTNSDLWRALKGGSNNFGIVTQLTARTIPEMKIWSGFTYHPINQTTKTLTAFHAYLNRCKDKGPESLYDERACGPVVGIGYVQAIGLSLIVLFMTHTNPPVNPSEWPACYASAFKSLWRLWSTCRHRTHENISAELIRSMPPGRREVQVTTTIKNDPVTLNATHAAWKNAVATIRKYNIKGATFTLVLQPLVPEWANKGDPNMFGLEDCEEPLVIVNLSLTHDDKMHDREARELARKAIEEIDAFAAKRGTGHRYRFINYAGEWQNVMESYGEANLAFLREVSRRVDPDGLFQRGCKGGFKLGMEYD